EIIVEMLDEIERGDRCCRAVAERKCPCRASNERVFRMSRRRQRQRIAIEFDPDRGTAVSPQRAKKASGARADIDDQTIARRVPLELADDAIVLDVEPPVIDVAGW